MAFTVTELVGRVRAQNVDGSQETRRYVLQGDNTTDTAETALIALQAAAGAAEGEVGLVTDSTRLTQEIRKHPTLMFFGEASFATTSYSYPVAPVPEVDTAEFTFNAQAPSGLIKTAYPGSTQTLYKATGITHDPKNYIGLVKSDGKWRIEGVQLSPPSPTFTFNYHPVNAKVTGAFSKDLLGYVGTTNNATFSIQGADYAANELLLTSISGSKRTGESWQLSLGFAYSPASTVTFADLNGGAPIAKPGHFYVWTMDNDGPITGALEFKPLLVGIAQVWQSTSWNAAIGTLPNGLTTIASVIV